MFREPGQEFCYPRNQWAKSQVSPDRNSLAAAGKSVRTLLECVWGSMASTEKKAGSIAAKPADSDSARDRSNDERDVGTALRAAYQQAVDEQVPSDLLDLLGKLS